MRTPITMVLALALALAARNGTAPAQDPAGEEFVQAGVVLTVADGKRLIGKAVARMPLVKKALRDGMVIITRGTTNTYVAEEILGKKIAHGVFVTGRILPTKNARTLPRVPRSKRMSEIVIVKGKVVSDLPYAEAVKRLKAGDVVIKGANLLDYPNKTAGVMIGAPNSGTIGACYPYIIAKRAHLVIPVGLEKQGSSPLIEVQRKMRQPIRSVSPRRVYSMFMVTGTIVTEIEALKILGDVDAFQCAAGGIGGAQGSSWLVWRGPKAKVENALKIARSVQGEPPFVP